MPPDLRYLVEIDEGLHRFSLEIMVSKLMSGREAMIGIEPIIQKEPCRIGDIFVATVSPCVYLSRIAGTQGAVATRASSSPS